MTHVDKVRPKRQVRAVLLDNSEWQQTCSLRLLDGGTEVFGRQFFPARGELRLRPGGHGKEEYGKECCEIAHQCFSLRASELTMVATFHPSTVSRSLPPAAWEESN